MKTLYFTIIVILVLSASSNNFRSIEAKCLTDANGNVIGYCGLPPHSAVNITNSNHTSQHEAVPAILYFLMITTVTGGGISFIIMKKMKSSTT